MQIAPANVSEWHAPKLDDPNSNDWESGQSGNSRPTQAPIQIQEAMKSTALCNHLDVERK
jgi:hypothetical protein